MHTSQWLNDIKDAIKPGAIYALVGNKVDLTEKRQVTKEEGEAMAKANKQIFQEVSAKNGINVNNLFYRDIFDQISKVLKGESEVVQEVASNNYNNYYRRYEGHEVEPNR